MTDDHRSLPPVFSQLSPFIVPLLFGVAGCVFAIISITIFIKTYQDVQPIQFSNVGEALLGASDSAIVGRTAPVVIDIEGGVLRPGVYQVAPGSRIEDVISKAGGFSNDADIALVAQSINRAAKVSDGMKLYIPQKTGKNQDGSVSGKPSCVLINSASATELDALSGIGSVTSAKIIAGRPYGRVEELVEKKIISQALFQKISGQLCL